LVIVEPPVLAGVVNAMVAVWFPAVADSEVGAPGVVYGVPLTVDDAVPVPIIFTALSLTEYVVPFVKLLIDTGLDVTAGLNAANDVPPFVEY